MDQLLFDLFALQQFAGDRALQAVIDEVEDRYAVTALDDEVLEKLSAAGDPYLQVREARDEDERL